MVIGVTTLWLPQNKKKIHGFMITLTDCSALMGEATAPWLGFYWRRYLVGNVSFVWLQKVPEPLNCSCSLDNYKLFKWLNKLSPTPLNFKCFNYTHILATWGVPLESNWLPWHTEYATLTQWKCYSNTLECVSNLLLNTFPWTCKWTLQFVWA